DDVAPPGADAPSVSAAATPAPAIIAADTPAVTTPAPNDNRNRSTMPSPVPDGGERYRESSALEVVYRKWHWCYEAKTSWLPAERPPKRPASQFEAHSTAVGVQRIGLSSGQVAMARPWRLRYRDD